MLKIEDLLQKQFAKIFKISISLLHKIKRMNCEQVNYLPNRCFIKLSTMEEKFLKKSI